MAHLPWPLYATRPQATTTGEYDLKMIKAAVLALGLCVYAAPVQAQMRWTDRGFVAVDGGVQSGTHDFTTSSSFLLYDETATVTTEQQTKGGGFFDVRGGFRVWRNLAIGAGFSSTQSKGDIVVTGRIPSPIVTDQFRDVRVTQADAKHTESALHVSGTWMVPVTDKVDVGFSAGPSFFFVKQETVPGLQIGEPGPSAVVMLEEQSETAVGYHVGLDVRYMVSKNVGIGGLARYTSAEVGLSQGPLKVGGAQVGGGLRIRF